MKLALILATILLTASVAYAKDPPAPRIGWVDSAKIDAGSTEAIRALAEARGKKTREEADQFLVTTRLVRFEHLKAACAKVKAARHFVMIVTDPLAADPADDVTDAVIKQWNADDVQGVAEERDRLTARVAQLEAAALTKPAPPAVPPPPPIQPAHVAKK